MASSKIFDALIIGGGPSGLSMAVTLARQAQTALILDSGVYRNAVSRHMHGVPGFDHVDPADFRAKVRKDLATRYGDCIEYKAATVKKVRKLSEEEEEGSGFEAVDEEGRTYRGVKLGLATGIRDVIEGEVEGYKECWGKGIFHCLFCHGFEERGADTIGVLVTSFIASMGPDMIKHVVRMAKNLAKHVVIYTNGHDDITTTCTSYVESSNGNNKLSLDSRPIRHLTLVDNGPQVRVTFEDGSEKVEGFITSHPSIELRGRELAEQLGLEMTPMGDVQVSPPWNETSVKGVFAAGDVATPMRNAMQALHMGSFAAGGMIGQLHAELEAKNEL